MKNIIKAASLAAGSFIISFMFLGGMVMLSEGYNALNPYADTEFAKDYTPEKFENVKEGMTSKQVREIAGEPLNVYYDTNKSVIHYSYTRDGYLRRRTDRVFPLAGDLAWYGSSVEFNKDSIAIKVFKGWYYD